MTSDEKAMLSAIIADPANDTPRLIYADWLEEQGDADRAEFIRIGMDMHRASLDYDEYLKMDANCYSKSSLGRQIDVLARRRSALLYKLSTRLVEPFTAERTPWHGLTIGQNQITVALKLGGPVVLKFRCGFVAEVHCTLADWISHGPAIVAAQPVEMVRVTDMRILPSGGNDTYYVDGLGRLPQQYWRQLEGLPSRGAAIAALSAALIAFAKAQRKEQA